MEPEIVTALVSAAGAEIFYRRAGAGSPVLLLRSRRDDDALLLGLAARHRVVEPVCAAFGDLSSWLRGLLDGLGVEQVALVAEDGLALQALAFALSDPLRVDRLVLLAPVPLDPAVVDVGATDRFMRRGRSFLLVRTADLGPARIVERVLAFLVDEEERPRIAP